MPSDTHYHFATIAPIRAIWSTLRTRAASPRALQLGAAALLALVIWGVVLQPRLFVPSLTRYKPGNFREHWWRLHTPQSVTAVAARKASLPKYRPAKAFPDFKIYVISMKNATARRASVQEQLHSRGIEFEFFDAVDGNKELPTDMVRWYTKGKRLRKFMDSRPGSREYKKQGSNLSNLRLMFKLLADGGEMQLVLEDDFELLDKGGDFLARLKALMAQLPEDWEYLWLHHGLKRAEIRSRTKTVQQKFDEGASTWVGKDVRLTVENIWSLSMFYRRSFALKVINDVQIGNKDVDDLINDICELGNAACYTADPALVGASKKKFQSEIEEEEDDCPHGLC